jgi:putative acetyltransferase
MIIRKFENRDAEQIARLFHDTIRNVNLGDYTQEQVEAWAPADIHFRDWAEGCSSRCTFVAEEGGVILGFGELDLDGHINRFYVHHRYQRQGVGTSIYAAIEAEGRKLNLSRLFTEASITARPFFESSVYQMVRQQTVSCRGQTFTNVVMEKRL